MLLVKMLKCEKWDSYSLIGEEPLALSISCMTAYERKENAVEAIFNDKRKGLEAQT